jgi:hypothetical protein
MPNPIHGWAKFCCFVKKTGTKSSKVHAINKFRDRTNIFSMAVSLFRDEMNPHFSHEM